MRPGHQVLRGDVMRTKRSGICHVDETHAEHQDAITFLWDLILDLEITRLGRTTGRVITPERLAKWDTHALGLRKCWKAKPPFPQLGEAGHSRELEIGDAFIKRIADQLAAGEKPTLPEDWPAWWDEFMKLASRCRDTWIKR
jgi:hypothetical protein